MKTVKSAADIRAVVEKHKQQKQTIGFVPTMGALHEGHISLIKRSLNENDISIVSIFVNPTQFNDPEDLRNYPRPLDKDLRMLEKHGCNYAFVPSDKEMYPEKDKRIFDFGQLEKTMEGQHRPGHFNGVAQIVSKLFDLIPADRVYFGLKDFQQLAIIKELVKRESRPVRIIGCPVVREPDGLAISSRNKLLSPEERKHAALISQTLYKARKLAEVKSLDEVKEFVVSTINSDPLMQTEYFEIVNEDDLSEAKLWDNKRNKIGCIAVKTGMVRLIDNVNFIS